MQSDDAIPDAAVYRPGHDALQTVGAPLPQERKSPPLDALLSTRAPRLGAPSMFYDRDHHQLEAERLWPRRWLCAGLARDAGEPGDWFTFAIGADSLIVARGNDGMLRAFHNVCQHRGNRLASDDFGRGRLICAYHAWAYDTAGRCAHVPDRRYFEAEALAGSLDLPGVACAESNGFVFISMDADPPPLETYLGEVADQLAPYRIGAMRVVKDAVVSTAANWKLVQHANLEAYHFPALHPLALPYADDLRQQIDFYPNGHNRFLTANGIPSGRLPPRSTVSEAQGHLLAEAGIDPAGYASGPGDVRGAIQAAKRRADNRFALDYGGFSDNQLTDDWSYAIFPNMSLNLHPEGVLFMRYLPHSSDPRRSWFHVMVLAPEMAEGCGPPSYMLADDDGLPPPGQRAARTWRDGSAPGLGWALDADCLAVAEVQKGVESRGFAQMRLSELEARIQHFNAEYAQCLSCV